MRQTPFFATLRLAAAGSAQAGPPTAQAVDVTRVVDIAREVCAAPIPQVQRAGPPRTANKPGFGFATSGWFARMQTSEISRGTVAGRI